MNKPFLALLIVMGVFVGSSPAHAGRVCEGQGQGLLPPNRAAITVELSPSPVSIGAHASYHLTLETPSFPQSFPGQSLCVYNASLNVLGSDDSGALQVAGASIRVVPVDPTTGTDAAPTLGLVSLSTPGVVTAGQGFNLIASGEPLLRVDPPFFALQKPIQLIRTFRFSGGADVLNASDVSREIHDARLTVYLQVIE